MKLPIELREQKVDYTGEMFSIMQGNIRVTSVDVKQLILWFSATSLNPCPSAFYTGGQLIGRLLIIGRSGSIPLYPKGRCQLNATSHDKRSSKRVDNTAVE